MFFKQLKAGETTGSGFLLKTLQPVSQRDCAISLSVDQNFDLGHQATDP